MINTERGESEINTESGESGIRAGREKCGMKTERGDSEIRTAWGEWNQDRVKICRQLVLPDH